MAALETVALLERVQIPLATPTLRSKVDPERAMKSDE